MAAKKKATPLTVPGRLPPPIGDVPAELAALRDELVAIEAMADPAVDGAAQDRAAALARRDIDPALAIRMLQLLPRDLGDVPPTVDASQAKTSAQRKQLDASLLSFVSAQLSRERSYATLYAIGARDLDFQARAWDSLDALPSSSHLFRGSVVAAILGANELAPNVRADVERLAARPTGEPDIHAIGAIFRTGGAERLLLPLLASCQTADEMQHAKAIARVGLETVRFAGDPAAWRAALEAIVARGAAPYEQSDRWRASFQLVAEAEEVLGELGTVKNRR